MVSAEGSSDLGNLVRHNAQAIIEGWLGQPEEIKAGEWWYCAPYRKDAHPSLRIVPETGQWYDDPKGTGGDLVTLRAVVDGLDSKKDFVDLVTKLLADAGIAIPDEVIDRKKPPAKIPPPLENIDDRKRLAEQYGLEWADFAAQGFGYWEQSFPSSAITSKIPAVQYPIIFSGGNPPASKWKSVARRTDTQKRLMRILPSGTKVRGLIVGKQFDLAKGKPLVIAGGEEKMLAAIKAGYVAFCPDNGEKELSPGQIDVVLKAEPTQVIIAYDNDIVGAENARKAAIKLIASGMQLVRIVHWPVGLREGYDLNDMLKERGPEAVAAVLDGARAYMAQMRKSCIPDPQDTLEDAIQIGPDEHRVVEDCLRSIASQESTLVFQRGGMLVRVREPLYAADNKTILAFPCIERVPTPAVRTLLTQCTRFARYDSRSGLMRECHPPDWLTPAVASAPEYTGIRPIAGVSSGPVIRENGSMFYGPGYDPVTGLYICSTPEEWPEVHKAPTMEEVKVARDFLMDLVCDFEFADEYDRAAWLSLVLTMVARNIIDGPSPSFKSDANTRGSGKSLLINLAGIIATGAELAPTGAPSDDAEWEKKITALALSGASYCFFDNLKTGGAIFSPHLEEALTARSWSGRVLGKSEVIQLPMNIIWLFSGNNVEVKGDLVRRVLPIRLKTASEFPESRDGFKYDPVTSHVVNHRAEYHHAAMTILVGWIKAGRPRYNVTPWGSFEAWSTTIRMACIFAGLKDPCMGRESLMVDGDTDRVNIQLLCDVIDELDKFKRGVTIRHILQNTTMDDYADSNLRDKMDAVGQTMPQGKISSVGLGKLIVKYMSRVVNGKSIERTIHANQNAYYVESHAIDSGPEVEA